jgi:hypothetical protein
MKKLLIAALLFVGLTTFAQEQRKAAPNRSEMEKLSPEQRNELLLKKMTLDLGLNDGQQKDMAKIIAEQSAKREIAMAERKANKEKGVKPSADERFAKENKRLDEQIALKEKVKKILTPDQFKKWEEMKAQHKERRHDRAEKRGNKMPKPE